MNSVKETDTETDMNLLRQIGREMYRDRYEIIDTDWQRERYELTESDWQDRYEPSETYW